jgi:hypothetical protein
MILTCLTGILLVEGLADFWPLQNLEWHSNNLLCPHTKPLELTFRRCSTSYQILHLPVSGKVHLNIERTDVQDSKNYPTSLFNIIIKCLLKKIIILTKYKGNIKNLNLNLW